jgi:hypothetical protein
MVEVETESLTQELFELRVRLLHRMALRDISPNIKERGGSVCLNSMNGFYKWTLTLVMQQPGLAVAQ